MKGGVLKYLEKNNDNIYEYPLIPANSAEDFPSNAFVLRDWLMHHRL